MSVFIVVYVILIVISAYSIFSANSSLQAFRNQTSRQLQLDHNINSVGAIYKQQSLLAAYTNSRISTFSGNLSTTSITEFFGVVSSLTANVTTLTLTIDPQPKATGSILDGISTSNTAAASESLPVASTQAKSMYTLENLNSKVAYLEQSQAKVNALVDKTADLELKSSLANSNLELVNKDLVAYREMSISLNDKVDAYNQQVTLALLALVAAAVAIPLAKYFQQSVHSRD